MKQLFTFLICSILTITQQTDAMEKNSTKTNTIQSLKYDSNSQLLSYLKRAYHMNDIDKATNYHPSEDYMRMSSQDQKIKTRLFHRLQKRERQFNNKPRKILSISHNLYKAFSLANLENTDHQEKEDYEYEKNNFDEYDIAPINSRQKNIFAHSKKIDQPNLITPTLKNSSDQNSDPQEITMPQMLNICKKNSRLMHYDKKIKKLNLEIMHLHLSDKKISAQDKKNKITDLESNICTIEEQKRKYIANFLAEKNIKTIKNSVTNKWLHCYCNHITLNRIDYNNFIIKKRLLDYYQANHQKKQKDILRKKNIITENPIRTEIKEIKQIKSDKLSDKLKEIALYYQYKKEDNLKLNHKKS